MGTDCAVNKDVVVFQGACNLEDLLGTIDLLSLVHMSLVSTNELNVCGLKPCSSSVLFDASTLRKETPGPGSNIAYSLVKWPIYC